MTEPVFYTPDLTFPDYNLSEEESKHAIRVLRMKVGEKLFLVDGKGGKHLAEIVSDNPKRVGLSILSSEKEVGKRPYSLHLVVAPTKNIDRMEWLLEKATEIGVDEISFIKTKRTERTVVKIERLNKIIESAMKQSGQAYHPQLNELIDLKDFLKKKLPEFRFIAHCLNSENKKELFSELKVSGNYLILIGPEGDFTPDEIQSCLQNNFMPVALGNSRLRTETAALYAVNACALKQLR